MIDLLHEIPACASDLDADAGLCDLRFRELDLRGRQRARVVRAPLAFTASTSLARSFCSARDAVRARCP